MPPGEFTPEYVQRLADLARLEITQSECEDLRRSLDAIVAYMGRLRDVDVEGIEPLAHVGEISNRLDHDEACAPLSRDILERLAPAFEDGFVRVPRVLGEGA
jgi:aspartyl-tRNA(Asn)/glutamyl-tRNA(Gln) amidotransferase subunit C